ncbi:DNA polymerase alpha/epsilon-like protein [Vairimorpha necatrix]|uniref:DNA polymerase alpha/epsilon-like protein n=1 Tax=Vairimorpha necatrix TaxID=6039 RepID=A0AAX4JBR9_9MICR
MSRHRDIYNIFTLKNNLKISKDVLSLLSSTDINLHDLVSEYKQASKGLFVDIQILKNILSKKCTLVQYKYEYIPLIHQYKYLRRQYTNITSISELTSKQSWIFGYIYINKENKKVIEDSSGVIKVEGCEYKDKFIYLQGKKENGIFITVQNKIDMNLKDNHNIIEYKIKDIKDIKDNITITRDNNNNLTCINLNNNLTCRDDNNLTRDNNNLTRDNVIINLNNNIHYINNDIPVIFTLNNLKVSVYNKTVLNDTRHIPVYLDNKNYNFDSGVNLFYKEDYDIFIVMSDTKNYIREYKGTIFIMLEKRSKLEINTSIKITEI